MDIIRWMCAALVSWLHRHGFVAVAIISNSCCLVLLLFYLSPSLLHCPCPCQWSPLPPIAGHQPLSSPSISITVDHSHHCHYQLSPSTVNHHHRLLPLIVDRHHWPLTILISTTTSWLSYYFLIIFSFVSVQLFFHHCCSSSIVHRSSFIVHHHCCCCHDFCCFCCCAQTWIF